MVATIVIQKIAELSLTESNLTIYKEDMYVYGKCLYDIMSAIVLKAEIKMERIVVQIFV